MNTLAVKETDMDCKKCWFILLEKLFSLHEKKQNEEQWKEKKKEGCKRSCELQMRKAKESYVRSVSEL